MTKGKGFVHVVGTRRVQVKGGAVGKQNRNGDTPKATTLTVQNGSETWAIVFDLE